MNDYPSTAEMVSDCLIKAIRNTTTMDATTRKELERIVREGLTEIICDEWITAQHNKPQVERALKSQYGRTKTKDTTVAV